jgi:SAM-dependent methyltransferase
MKQNMQLAIKTLIYNLVSPVARRILRRELAGLKQVLNDYKAEASASSKKAAQTNQDYQDQVARLNASFLQTLEELRLTRESKEASARKLSFLYDVFPADEVDDPVPEEFQSVQLAYRALMKLLSDYEFETVLDIGSGAGEQATVFLSHGKKVTALDYGKSPYYERRDPAIQTVIGDFNTYPFEAQFDCVWASHVLEHQANPNIFLRKIHHVTKENGIVAITVPPLKHQIVGGHVTLWNAGLLLYHLVLAGFDCRNASVLRYGYNISVIVQKKTFEVPDDIAFDQGDIRKIKHALPSGLDFAPNALDDPFNGDIVRLNW